MKAPIDHSLQRAILSTSRATLKKVLRKIYYFGRRSECPLCRSRVRAMLPFGYDFPVHAELKVCRSRAAAGSTVSGL